MNRVVPKVQVKEIKNIIVLKLYRGRLDYYSDGEFVRSDNAECWRTNYKDALKDARKMAKFSGELVY